MSNNCAILQFYQTPALTKAEVNTVLKKASSAGVSGIVSVKSEFCYYVDAKGQLTPEELKKIEWILTPNFESKLSSQSILRASKNGLFIEIGPRLNFSTALSTNACSVCQNIGLEDRVDRIEKSTLYSFEFQGPVSKEQELKLVDAIHDRMTEQRYQSPITTFQLESSQDDWYEIDVMTRGEDALREVSAKLGLAFDDWDIKYYCELFRDKLKRNPTSVECFDLAQSNSEHSRHWFFKGKIFVDGKEVPKSLIDMVASTQETTNKNNVIAFNDNSSAIIGFNDLNIFQPKNSSEPSFGIVKTNQSRHIIFTAETHNFPTGVAPFPGATTGTGGRIRDVQAAGRGAHVIAATAGYSFGNLHIPGYDLEWEDKSEIYPYNFASPLSICIEASNGASDYGNKFGEPVLAGFCRSFGQRNGKNERVEYIKPIMFSGGIGTIDADMVKKHPPQVGMQVAKVGGPIYRIGVGGGAASSTEVQGAEGSESLDFGAVQRGDAEMEQKLNRLIRACIEHEDGNVIESIHDQGAGGNGNVLKEISEPLGAKIFCDRFSLGDPTVNTMELWGAEYQESNAILVAEKNKALLDKISIREKCKVDFVGHITGDEHITLVEKEGSDKHPVHLNLEHVLGSMPRKRFDYTSPNQKLSPLKLPTNFSLDEALKRVLRLPVVSSKRFLTTKVDRCVTGLIAQQQCIGPLHTPLADYGAIALNYYTHRGSVTSIGEQPIKGLISPSANGRLSVAEAITNLMFCVITELADVKCSGNWMWPAKLEGEGALLVKTCESMVALMRDLNIAIDGGKDSLSMAAKVKGQSGGHEVIKSPGTLVISAYAPVPDVRVRVTPEMSGDSSLVYVNLSGTKKFRLGGSALAQVCGQLGDVCPDIDDSAHLKKGFNLVQDLIREKLVTAGHDVSDGGLITALLEMAFASNMGLSVDVDALGHDAISALFAEEAGVVIEVKKEKISSVMERFRSAGLNAQIVGKPVTKNDVEIRVDGQLLIKNKMTVLRDFWEETNFEIEKLQANPECVKQEQEGLKLRKTPNWKLTFDPAKIIMNIDAHITNAPKVAVIREEGTNGDREMLATFFMVGFEVCDITVTDLVSERTNLDAFRGVAFPGGFSYADVLGSARGWAATLKFNSKVETQLERFRQRSNTFSLGVCNGCQLMALLGWVGAKQDKTAGVMLDHNTSGRFECRFPTVRISDNNPAIMFADMHGTSLGVWSAHGEGRFRFENPAVRESVHSGNCVAMHFVDDDNRPTMQYPQNPNGSEDAIAGLCSPDGRHLAMMPHPERCSLSWQMAYVPKHLESIHKVHVSPWAKMFENAFKWCMDN